MERGEQSEAGGERLARTPLHQVPTELLFEWAKEKQRYIEKRLQGTMKDRQIEEVVEQLERYITLNFSTLPEVVVQSRDALMTVQTFPEEELTKRIQFGPIPFMKLEPTIYGHLYGFHSGESGDLRAYVARGEQPEKFTGGVYTPLVSVGLEGSTIRFIEDTYDSEYEKAGDFAIHKVGEYENDTINGLFMLFRSHLEDSDSKMMTRLKQSAEVMLQMITLTQEKTEREKLTDALWDMMRAKLRLTVPYNVDVSSHRLLRGKNGYKPAGPGSFSHVDLQLCLAGETDNPLLMFYFTHGNETIQVPLHTITRMYKSDVS